MTQHVKALAAGTAGVTPVDAPTKKDLLQTVARMFRRRGTDIFKAIPDVEGKSVDELRQVTAAGTALEPVVAVLNAANVPTDPSAHGVMASIPVDQAELHNLVCECLGATATGDTLADRFFRLADRS